LAGVGVQVEKDSVFIINTIISKNRASTNGAGVALEPGMHAILINNTIFGNTTSNTGGGKTAGIYHLFSNNQSTQTLISNCIIRGNTVESGTHTKGTQISFTDTVYSSNIQDTVNGTGIGIKMPGWSFSGIIDEDPLFVNSSNLPGSDGYYFTDDDGLMLNDTSPSRNTGGDIYAHNEWIPTVDIRGENRTNSIIDMGAYER
jgi:parallel beta-helix repeat protein